MTTTTDLSADQRLDLLAITHHIVILTHTSGEKGRYYHPRLISLRHDLGPVAYRCTLAHELAHAVAGDDPTATGWARTRQEAAADQQAAQWLISPVEYALAEQLHGPHPGAIAHELGVTLHTLNTWKDTWQRHREQLTTNPTPNHDDYTQGEHFDA